MLVDRVKALRNGWVLVDGRSLPGSGITYAQTCVCEVVAQYKSPESTKSRGKQGRLGVSFQGEAPVYIKPESVLGICGERAARQQALGEEPRASRVTAAICDDHSDDDSDKCCRGTPGCRGGHAVRHRY